MNLNEGVGKEDKKKKKDQEGMKMESSLEEGEKEGREV